MDPLSRLVQSKTFHAKNRPKSFLRTPDGYDGRKFSSGGKNNFFVYNFQLSEFVCCWPVNRESVKELIYQKKNGGYQASKRVISHNASKQPPTSCVGTLYIP